MTCSVRFYHIALERAATALTLRYLWDNLAAPAFTCRPPRRSKPAIRRYLHRGGLTTFLKHLF